MTFMHIGVATCRAAFLASLTALALTGCLGDDDDDAPPPLASDPALTRSVASVQAGLKQELGASVPSLSVLIETPQGAYFATAGDPGDTVVTPDTHFRFASNTKTFAAAAVMKMNQDGWLNYTDLVTAPIPGSSVPYVPDTAPWAIPNKQSITIRQLLQHSAGVFDVANDPVPGCADTYEDCVLARDPSHTFTSEELVSQVTRYSLSYFLPGQGYHYSDTGFTMLAEIVARVYSQRSGQPRTWADYVRDHLTGPATAVPLSVSFPDSGLDQVLPSPRACGRIILPGNAPAAEFCDINMSAKVAEGNGIGTMRDLNRWVRSVYGGNNVLSAQTVGLMQNDTSATNASYGLGTIRVENLGVGHNGATYGNLSLMLYDPVTDVSVIVFLPLWDLSDGSTSFLKTFDALNCAGWRAREALGYSGAPASASCPAA